MAKIRVKTPAKINLSLKVGNVRPDGFHPVESVMAAVNLFDYIDIETFEKKDKKALPYIAKMMDALPSPVTPVEIKSSFNNALTQALDYNPNKDESTKNEGGT